MSETNNFKLGVIEDNNLVTIVNDNFAKVDQALLRLAEHSPFRDLQSIKKGMSRVPVRIPSVSRLRQRRRQRQD